MSSEAKLTMPEVLEKMSRVMVFNVVVMLPSGLKDVFLMPNGKIEFYADAEEAKAALSRARQANPKKSLTLESVPLGKAFSLVQGVMGMSTTVPTQLLFSSAIVEAVGESGVPETMREDMRGAGPWPLFFVQQLASPGALPFFLSRDDLAQTWLKSGRTLEELDATDVEVIDLRMLAASAMQGERTYFSKILFIPPRPTVLLQKELAAQAEGGEVRRNMLAAKAIVDAERSSKSVALGSHIENPDTPPALMPSVAAK